MINRSTKKVSCFMLLLCGLLSVQSGVAAPADDFVTTWKTDNPGTSNSTSITLPMIGGPYAVDWDNDGTFDQFNVNGSVTHNFGASGTYTIRVRNTYDVIRFNNSGDKSKILSLDQWGTNVWKSMGNAFSGAENLVIPAVDTPNFSSVTSMFQMFILASAANPDTSNWNTSAVTDMRSMFSSATSANPDTSNWDTSAVTDMSFMFVGATAANPDTSNWDTSAVTDMSFMFTSTTSANPDTSNWDTSAVTTMRSMFQRAISANPDTSNWSTSAVTDMSFMFISATSANPDTSNWNTSAVTTMRSMFQSAISASPDTSNWNTSAVTDMQLMFSDATSANPDTSGWDTSAVKTMQSMFASTTAANPDTSNWNTSAVTSMESMFNSAFVANPNTSNWNTSEVITMLAMFTGATAANPDTSNWNTSEVTTMFGMFAGAIAANPDTSNWNTSVVRDMGWMFKGATAANPDTSNWSTSEVTSMVAMFNGATSANPDTSNWDTSAVNVMWMMFAGATAANPNTSNWDTSVVGNMGSMFSGATSFDQNIGSWDVTSLTFAQTMFSGVALSSINYDSLLIGWNAQVLRSGVRFNGGNSKYCSAAAIVARANLISVQGWNLTDGGQGCPVAPAAPTVAPVLTAATDTGETNSDNITANSSPQFEVICSAIGNAITLVTNIPVVNTAIGTHECTFVGTEIATTTAVLIDGIHNISYIDQFIGERSGHSPALAVTIDTIVTPGPGSLSAPGSPITDVNANIIGSCGPEAANDTVVVTTTTPAGFTTLYNTPITLDTIGGFSIVNPNWSEGTFTLHFECSDVAGNTATLGPFGPILIDTSCSGTDTIVIGDFPAGMHLCAGTNSLTTSGNVNLEVGAVVYFQSPEIILNPGFNVSEGASLISSSIIGPVAPLLLGPTTVKASVGEIVDFSASHICEDYEDGVLPITPFDSGVLIVSTKPEVFTLSCIGLDGVSTQMEVQVITE